MESKGDFDKGELESFLNLLDYIENQAAFYSLSLFEYYTKLKSNEIQDGIRDSFLVFIYSVCEFGEDHHYSFKRLIESEIKKLNNGIE